MKRPELLAPAGSKEALYGAFRADADAVYLGLSAYSARAAAENFTKDELLKALSFAQKRNRRIYLTLNTLVKEREMEEVLSTLTPFVAEGLHGVIVQDFGLLKRIREQFPCLAVHASTQMMVTGLFGARLLKQYGVKRVVPARELTLPEIAAIRKEAEIEVEAFVHGAMCYCYSGNCLFSGIVGGRSGNRGRCAQACRLPYQVDEGAEASTGGASTGGASTGGASTGGASTGSATAFYPLSLKDMCTVEYLPELIEAGIDSFKIEGRMKRPEYAAGVTGVYRKYIDRYLESPESEFRVEEKDMELLRNLYLRTDVSSGYLFRHNEAQMVTMKNPGYGKASEKALAQVRKKYFAGRR